jgi:hypothetical protein
MRKLLLALLAAWAGGAATGCASMTAVQMADYKEMKAGGLAVQEKNPGAAAALGVLPGGGSFYTRQYGLGVLDLLLWPYSVLWDPFIAYNEAEALNYSASRSHVRRIKSEQMAELERQLEDREIPQDEFIRRRRALDAQLHFE